MIRLKDSEGKVVETEKEICEELNPKFQSLFTMENILPQRWRDGMRINQEKF